MMHKVWSDIEVVPYWFYRSSVKFWCHTGWKIDLDLILARSQGRSQLTNPQICFVSSDLNHLWMQSYIATVKKIPKKAIITEDISYHFCKVSKYQIITSILYCISPSFSSWHMVHIMFCVHWMFCDEFLYCSLVIQFYYVCPHIFCIWDTALLQ